MLRDFVYAARTLRSSSAFAAVAILTLTPGIGASTAIFSVADAVLLRPLSYKDPDRLVYACSDLKTRNVSDHLWRRRARPVVGTAREVAQLSSYVKPRPAR